MVDIARTVDAVSDDTLLARYLEDIGRFEPVNDIEARNLATVVADGAAARAEEAAGTADGAVRRGLRRRSRRGEDAERELVQRSLHLVVPIASRYGETAAPPLLDLVQHGNLGLMKAVKSFSPGGEIDFDDHVESWVRRAIEEGLADDDV